MRTIKFRVWDKIEKRMAPVTSIDFPVPKLKGHHTDVRVNYMISKLKYSWTALGGDYELMQYTGLKDKNGNEIYEGDIVKGLIAADFGEYFQVKGEVTWSNNKAMFMVTSSMLFELSPQSEVIGNIYENKEVLK